jgi:hypothetical protein
MKNKKLFNIHRSIQLLTLITTVFSFYIFKFFISKSFLKFEFTPRTLKRAPRHIWWEELICEQVSRRKHSFAPKFKTENNPQLYLVGGPLNTLEQTNLSGETVISAKNQVKTLFPLKLIFQLKPFFQLKIKKKTLFQLKPIFRLKSIFKVKPLF